jgi:hypothetical protein
MTGEDPNVDRAKSAQASRDVPRYELKLSFDELTLIQKSLLAAKSLGVLSQENELVDDTIQLVDQELAAAV